MTISDDELRQYLSLGEDSRWEFKQIEFKGNQPTSPKRDNLADEMIAFANGIGGYLVCGVMDDGQVQGMSTEQMSAIDQLLVEIGRDIINPPLRFFIHKRELDGKRFVLAEIPKGTTVHERAGRAFVRAGSTKRRMNMEESLRLARIRAESSNVSFDNRIVPETGFETLNERLWEPLLSVFGSENPRIGLKNLHLLAEYERRVLRATIAGVLLCTDSPQQWLQQAAIMATHYPGKDRASGQLDAQEIIGPLGTQIADAAKFVVRNMRVAARKTPARENMPQYSKTAVFEAIVNAVVHRDYSMSSRRIRLSMFEYRLEIDSPGQLPNGMTVEDMNSIQVTRNEVIASVFGRFPVGDIPGSEHRLYLMERRGDGVTIILKKIKESAGISPKYRIVGNTNLVLTLPSAKLELSPNYVTIAVHSRGEPLAGVEVLAIYPNNTVKRITTNEAGEAVLNFTRHIFH